ncbi:MAG TPA: peptide ABC transporter substrate-binding protein [Candidatus Dormibacteraeota bacterium]|nr:peptide ABC transporter substrate-binding protein [Candidatus Dormibacteraeota bacterium]
MTLALTGLFVVSACGGGGTTSQNLASPDKQVINMNDGTEPNSYDPTQQTYVYEAAVGRNVFETLLKSNKEGTDVISAAAESYKVSDDGLTYTFKLRSGAKWSDGKAVTAADWVYGYKHLLNPALAAGYVDPFFDSTIKGADGYGDVDVSKASAIDTFLSSLGLTAPDPNTFVITLQHPAAFFKWVVTLWMAAPIRQDVVEQAAGGTFPSSDTTKAEIWAQKAATIIGNGAFKISEIVSKDHVTLVPNPSYWGGAPHLQKIVLWFIEDANTAYAKYQTGDLDAITVPLANVDVVRNDPKLSKEAKVYPKLTTFWMAYNAQKPPFDNPKVRMAFAKSIDRDKLNKQVQHGIQQSISSFIPKGMAGYDTSNNAQSFDAAAAKKLLTDAGVTADQLNKFKLLTRNTTRNKTLNQFIVDQWNTNLGLNLQLEVIDSKTVTSRLRKGQFDLYGPDGWGADYPDQQDWFDLFFKGACHSLNWGCADIPGYDDLVKKADSELDQNQRNADYKKAQDMLIDQAVVGFIFQDYEYNLIKPYLGGLTITASDDQSLPGSLFWHDAFVTQH